MLYILFRFFKLRVSFHAKLNFIVTLDVVIYLSFVLFKIGYEFDFLREAYAMERIRHFLYKNNKKTPVLVPRVLQDLVTRQVHVVALSYMTSLNR